jgi:phosphate transport system substrate-binding protein
MLLNNELAFAQSSRKITKEEYEQATQRGFTLKEIPVAFDGIAVAVHPTLKIPGLTIAQLKDIYLGKVMNWKEVGGPDLLITVYSGRKGDGSTINFFMESVLDGENFGGNIQFISSTREALRKVESNTGGIYYASAPEIVRRCDVKALPLGLQANALVSPYKEPFVPIDCTQRQRNQINPQVFTTGQYPLTRALTLIVKQNGKEEQRAGEAYSQLLLTKQGQELITRTGFVSVR